MARRRMFSLDVVDTDRFLDMPSSTQLLYFHLGMRADDDGFVASPRRVATICGCCADDIKLLITKGFVVPFDTGVIFIMDWRKNNQIRPDRYTPTQFQEEKALIASGMSTGIPSGNQKTYQLETQSSIGKDSVVKVVKRGQFAMNKMKAWQGSYGISAYTGIVSPAYFIFDVDFENLEYFHYALRSTVYVNFFARASDGIRVGQWDLQMDKMKEIPFIVPAPSEQEEIVAHIKGTLPKYDRMTEKLMAEVEKLEEYKTKLISDAVTGKIDVRDIEVPDYEYTREEMDEAGGTEDGEMSALSPTGQEG